MAGCEVCPALILRAANKGLDLLSFSYYVTRSLSLPKSAAVSPSSILLHRIPFLSILYLTPPSLPKKITLKLWLSARAISAPLNFQARRWPSPSPTRIDVSDLVAILTSKCITEVNKTDITALAASSVALSAISKGSPYTVGKDGVFQPQVIATLHEEAGVVHGQHVDLRPVAQTALRPAVDEIKLAFDTRPVESHGRASYAAIARRIIHCRPHAKVKALMGSPELINLHMGQECSYKLSLSPYGLPKFCNTLPMDFFARPKNGAAFQCPTESGV